MTCARGFPGSQFTRALAVLVSERRTCRELPAAYHRSMTRRLIPVLAVLLALQSVATPSFVFGMESPDSMPSSHCADQSTECTDPCPCCPDGSSPVPGCMSICTAFIAAFADFSPGLSAGRSIACSFVGVPLVSRTYAPPNPPPIRS